MKENSFSPLFFAAFIVSNFLFFVFFFLILKKGMKFIFYINRIFNFTLFG